MEEMNGKFREEEGFAIARNSMARNKNLSLEAKGLYILICSFLSADKPDITKEFLVGQCREKKKAFDSAWNELLNMGYLKIHDYPDEIIYELLDVADIEDGIYLYRYDQDGNIIGTNRD